MGFECLRAAGRRGGGSNGGRFPCWGLSIPMCPLLSFFFRRPHSTYTKVVQGKCPFILFIFNGFVCSNTLLSNTSALTNSLLFRANSTCKVLEHLVWSNTSGFQFWAPLARTNFLSVPCGLPVFGVFPIFLQWNPKCGCKGTITTRFALIALVAWQH